jgi:Rrf2 family protein
MLLTKTTELAIQCLVYLARRSADGLLNPSEIAERCGESPTYVAKVLRMLGKLGILRAHRGMAGGYELVRDPGEITLLEVVEASQGTVPGNYCKEVSRKELRNTCGYHQAMQELQEGVRASLSAWTIGRIAKAPKSSPKVAPECRLSCLQRE